METFCSKKIGVLIIFLFFIFIVCFVEYDNISETFNEIRSEQKYVQFKGFYHVTWICFYRHRSQFDPEKFGDLPSFEMERWTCTFVK